MICIIKNEDIALADTTAIVNASNGQGFMGGKKGVVHRRCGVAESLHYESKGAIEPLAKAKCKKHSLFGYGAGKVFVTQAPNLKCDYIIHAITMRFPASKAKIKNIKKLLPEIVHISEKLNCKSVAIPLLGTGTGRLNRTEVLDMYSDYLKQSKVMFYIYVTEQLIFGRPGSSKTISFDKEGKYGWYNYMLYII